MDISHVTPPDEADVLNLVTTAAVKRNERITHAHTDELIGDCIKQAYAFLDGRYGWLNRSILTQEWKLWLPRFSDCIELPFGPVQTVGGITYIDADGVEQTIAPSAYEVLGDEYVARVVRVPAIAWPRAENRQRAVAVTYTAGFGDAEQIPFPVKASLQKAILLLAAHFYRNPSATYAEPRVSAVNRSIEYGLESLVGFLRVPPDLS